MIYKTYFCIKILLITNMVQVSKLHTLRGHTDCIYSLHKGVEDNEFYSGAGDGMVVKWDINDPDNGQLLVKVPNSVYSLCLTDDHLKMIVGHNYEGIHIIDISTKKELASLKLTDAAIFDIKTIGSNCAVATGTGEVFIISIAGTQVSILHKIKASDKSARCISINRSLGIMAVGYSDHLVRIFSLDDFQLLQTLTGHTNSVFTVRFTPDGQKLITAGRDARFKVWNVNTWELVETVVAHLYAINHIDFSPNGKHFVTCSMDKSVKVWDLATFKLLKVIDKSRHAGHGTSVNKLLWSTHENQLISASDDRTISIWDIKFS
jgi:WD40 repeat protein